MWQGLVLFIYFFVLCARDLEMSEAFSRKPIHVWQWVTEALFLLMILTWGGVEPDIVGWCSDICLLISLSLIHIYFKHLISVQIDSCFLRNRVWKDKKDCISHQVQNTLFIHPAPLSVDRTVERRVKNAVRFDSRFLHRLNASASLGRNTKVSTCKPNWQKLTAGSTLNPGFSLLDTALDSHPKQAIPDSTVDDSWHTPTPSLQLGAIIQRHWPHRLYGNGMSVFVDNLAQNPWVKVLNSG